MTFSALAAAVICSGSFPLFWFIPLTGIFCLAAGASVLNQVQEITIDGKMKRTLNRPLPGRRISPRNALIMGIAINVAGILILYLTKNLPCLLLGLLNIAWYNGLYTWLKKKTAFAVVPGAVTGAIPVLMGWSVAGGSLLRPEGYFLAFVVFVWQVPHFWLLMLSFGNQYLEAGLPSMMTLFSVPAMKRIILSWTIASSAASLLLIFVRLVQWNITIYSLILLNAFLIFLMIRTFFMKSSGSNRALFIAINIFLMLFFIILMADRVFILG